ncbi:MAG: hypothetical protein ACOX2A_01975 [Tepidanaerobacteraceae bacterium]
MAKVTPCFENGNIAIVEGLLNRYSALEQQNFIYSDVTADAIIGFYFIICNLIFLNLKEFQKCTELQV